MPPNDNRKPNSERRHEAEGYMTEREKQLENELAQKNLEISRLHSELVDVRLDGHDKILADHEQRVRSVELVATRSNVIFALTTGGGLISAIVLIRTLLNIP